MIREKSLCPSWTFTSLMVAAWLKGIVAVAGLLGSVAVAAEPTVAQTDLVPQRLRVAVFPIAAAVEWKGDQPTGVAIELWTALAQRIGVDYEFVRMGTFKQVLDCLPGGEADVALGPIAITEERERFMDLTHPIAHSGLRIAVRHRESAGFLQAVRSLLSWDLLQALGVVLMLALASGHLLWWFECRDNPQSFPPQYPWGMVEAIWWIASTVVAGGCDNKHVASGLGRTIAFAWMIGGIVLLAASTSVLTATLTVEQVTGTIHGPKELAGRTVGCQEAGVTVKSVRQRGGIPQEFLLLTQALDALGLGAVDAVVGENQQMMVLLSQPGRQRLRLVGPIFETFDFGFGLPSGSPLREQLNTAILKMREDGTVQRIFE